MTLAELSDALSMLVSQTYGESSIVFLENASREVEIGIHDYEMGSTQPVRFDVYVAHEGDPSSPISDIDDVLNYEYLQESIEKVIHGERFGLLEELASELLDCILEPDSAIAATVKISKTSIPGVEGSLGCCVTRFK